MTRPPCRVEVSRLAADELRDLFEEAELVDELAEAKAFLSEPFVPGGKVTKMTNAEPPLWEYRASTSRGELRLFYFEYAGVRSVEMAVMKKRKRLPRAVIDTAQARASSRHQLVKRPT